MRAVIVRSKQDIVYLLWAAVDLAASQRQIDAACQQENDH